MFKPSLSSAHLILKRPPSTYRDRGRAWHRRAPSTYYNIYRSTALRCHLLRSSTCPAIAAAHSRREEMVSAFSTTQRIDHARHTSWACAAARRWHATRAARPVITALPRRTPPTESFEGGSAPTLTSCRRLATPAGRRRAHCGATPLQAPRPAHTPPPGGRAAEAHRLRPPRERERERGMVQGGRAPVARPPKSNPPPLRSITSTRASKGRWSGSPW